MKRLMIISLLLYVQLGSAQTKGNRTIVTETFDAVDLNRIKVNLYGDITIDMNVPEGITLTTDENLIDLIDTEVVDGVLTLTQKKWIQPSKMEVFIGAPELIQIEQSTHDKTIVKNIKGENFAATALIGSIELSGTVSTLNANGEIGEIDARKLAAEEVLVNLWDRGRVILGEVGQISGTIKEGELIYDSADKVKLSTKSGGTFKTSSAYASVKRAEARFITFKLKNNSKNRINCYVIGPKPDGKRFSYGFPMAPGQTRKKDWSVGSKVYRVTGVGTRKLLKEITAADEGGTVNLYDK